MCNREECNFFSLLSILLKNLSHKNTLYKKLQHRRNSILAPSIFPIYVVRDLTIVIN